MVEFRIPTDIPDPQPRSRTGYISVVISPSRYLVSGVADFGDVSAHYSGAGALRLGQRVRVDAAPDLHGWEIRAVGHELRGPDVSDHVRVDIGTTPTGFTQARGTSRAQVIKDAQTIYQFSNNICLKSADGGATWSSLGAWTTGTVETWDIYYEGWTNAANTRYIHIIAGRFGADWHHIVLDTDDDSYTVNAISQNSNANFSASICVAASGRLWVVGEAASALTAYSDDLGANWTTVTAMGQTSADRHILWPDLFSADPDDFLAVRYDSGGSLIEIRQYDASAETISDTQMLTGVGISRDSWIQLASSMDRDTGSIYVVTWDVANMSPSTPGDLRCATWNGSTGSEGAALISAEGYGIAATMARDPGSGDIYGVYSRDADQTDISAGEVYYKKSTDGMATWGPETQYATLEGSYRFLFSDPIPSEIFMPAVGGGAAGGDLDVYAPVALEAGAPPAPTEPVSHDDLLDVSADDHHAQDHAARHAEGGGDEIDAGSLGSGAATDGQVLTADGAGGAAWEDAAGGVHAKRGQATVEHPDTDVDVQHTLGTTPGRGEIQVTPANDLGDATKFWLSDFDASKFRVNLDQAPGVGNTAQFDWLYHPGEEVEQSVIEAFTSDGTWDWTAAGQPATVEVLVVAGGGGGGSRQGGGGGGGGVVYDGAVAVNGNVSVTVGAGGAGGTSGGRGTNGSDSAFGALTATGGGGGGGRTTNNAGANGGSGGGGANNAGGGTGTTGQGNDGGSSANTNKGGGGGGAGAVGASAAGTQAGAGGVGSEYSQFSAFGEGGFFGGGGGGGAFDGTAGAGGTGGGGDGHATSDTGSSAPGEAGTANTGGGGGGSSFDTHAGGAGGSGIVLVRYARP